MFRTIFIAVIGASSVAGVPLQASGASPKLARDSAASTAPAAPPQPPRSHPLAKACVVQHTTEVRYRGFGYDHYVHIANGCDAAVACTIHSSDNAEETRVTVAGASRVEVLVQRGSPAASFTASVYCKAVG